ncbi:hypothetical protein Q8F55_002008 [Vanrija albida]|uniref:Uncharacterized protein n=1 Tax=Vanrija albida TaxID=181172 RepID=A0ABR3Q9F4_9TREE
MHAIRPPAPATALFSTPSALSSAASLPPPSPSRAERQLRSVLERERRRDRPPPPPPPPPSRATSPAAPARPLPLEGRDECDLVALVERSIALQASPGRARPAPRLESPFASDAEDGEAPPARRPRFSTSPRASSGYESDSGCRAGSATRGAGESASRLAAALAAATSSPLPVPRAASHTASTASGSTRAPRAASATTPPSAFAFPLAPAIARIQSLSAIRRREAAQLPQAQQRQPATPSGSQPKTPPRLPVRASHAPAPAPPSPRLAWGIKPRQQRHRSTTTLPTPPGMPFRPGSPLPLPSPRPDPPPRPPSAPPRRPSRWRAESAPPTLLPSPPPTPPLLEDDGPLLIPALGAPPAFDVDVAARRLRALPGRVCFDDDVALPPPDDEVAADGPHPRMGRRWSLW